MATVTDVINQAKWIADRTRGGRFVTADVLAVIKRLYREAWEIIILANRSRWVKTGPAAGSFTLTGGAGSNSYQIAESDFVDLFDDQRGAVQMKDGDKWYDVPPYRRELGRLSWYWEGDTIFFEPIDDCAGTYRFRYVYKPPELVDENSTIVDFNGHVERYCVDSLATLSKIRDEEQIDSALERMRSKFETQIQRAAGHRAAPQRVIDVRTRRMRANILHLPEDE